MSKKTGVLKHRSQVRHGDPFKSDPVETELVGRPAAVPDVDEEATEKVDVRQGASDARRTS